MQKSDEPYIRHILDAITLVEEYVEGLDKDQFLDVKNKLVQDAVVRELEVIGEGDVVRVR